jgi:hypothetical protein
MAVQEHGGGGGALGRRQLALQLLQALHPPLALD